MNWYVLQTKPKKEKDVESQLVKATYEVFLPKTQGLHTPIPLFPSYLFIRASFDVPHYLRMVRFTRGVRGILGDESGPQPLSSLIVEALREQTKDGSLIAEDLLFQEGDEVTVKKGILKDLKGMIQKNLPAQRRIKVLFKWLHGSIKADFKYTDLEKAA